MIDVIEWRAADRAFLAAERRVLAALREALTIGALVDWLHGTNRLSGLVLGLSSTSAGYRNARVRVRADSGKEYWVHAGRILAAS